MCWLKVLWYRFRISLLARGLTEEERKMAIDSARLEVALERYSRKLRRK